MKIVFAGHQERGRRCLDALEKGPWKIQAVLGHWGAVGAGTVTEWAKARGVRSRTPEDPNHPSVVAWLKELGPDIIVLAGYGKILKREILNVPSWGTINLHGGRLPQYRGSSPMNWALLRGEKKFGISILEVGLGIDDGPVLSEKVFPIGKNDTIADLQKIANENFPRMLVEVLRRIIVGKVRGVPQKVAEVGYYPLRFPEDGMIFWDCLSAEEVHNTVRALSDPAPNAFTYFGNRRILLKKTRQTERPHYGEPGRVYRNNGKGLLVCAKDQCLWVIDAYFADCPERFLGSEISRYSSLATIKNCAMRWLATRENCPG